MLIKETDQYKFCSTACYMFTCSKEYEWSIVLVCLMYTFSTSVSLPCCTQTAIAIPGISGKKIICYYLKSENLLAFWLKISVIIRVKFMNINFSGLYIGIAAEIYHTLIKKKNIYCKVMNESHVNGSIHSLSFLSQPEYTYSSLISQLEAI